ncbi:MAG: hypothetical protein ACYDEF_00655 [Methanosarcina sp.]|nr:hypothetical protein BGV40_01790 [Methanosarcina sp. Ant1]
MASACVNVLAMLADPSSAKNAGKERVEAGFRLFWNNINRLLVDHLFLSDSIFFKEITEVSKVNIYA